MAAKEDDLDIDVEGSEKPKSKKLLIIGLIVLMMTVSGGGAWYFATMSMGTQQADAEGEGGEAEVKKMPLNYVPINPAFVVNFDGTEDISFLQVSIQVGTRDSEAIAVVKEHRPAIRNSLVMLFSSQNPASLNDRKGKDKLRSDALAEVQRVLETATGSSVVENIYFTSFVMQ